MKLTVKIDDVEHSFEFKTIRLFEEVEFLSSLEQFEKLKGAEKGDAEYKYLVDSLAKWAVEPSVVRSFLESLDIAVAERVANGFVRAYRSKIQPDIVF